MKSVELIFVLCFIISGNAYTKAEQNEVIVHDETESDEVVYRKYMEMDKALKEMVSYGIKRLLRYFMQASEQMNLSSKCMRDILKLTTGIRTLKMSAFNFLDANAKLSEGYFRGNMHLLGDYDQCLESSMTDKNGEELFTGQYCLLSYRPLLPRKRRPITLDGGAEELVKATENASEVVRFMVSKAHLFYNYPSKLGICVPSGCTEDDIKQASKFIAGKVNLHMSLTYCDDGKEVFLTTGKIVIIFLFSMVGLFAVLGTLFDYYCRIRQITIQHNFAKAVLCFSVLINFPKAISTKRPDDAITCLDGIRVLSLFYVILLHQYYAVVKYFITSHANRSVEEIPQFFMQIITNGFLTADVFFFISGLLNSYTRINMKNSGKSNKNFIMLLLHRWVRVGPAYLFFSLLMSLFKPYGPMRLYEKRQYVEKCEKYWWQNALYINNYFHQDDTCAPHVWYLAADMQLFYLSLFTVPLLLKSAKKGIIVNSAMIFLGVFITIILSWVKKLTPAIIFYRPNLDETNDAWNAQTWTFPHIAPYFTGILMGYILTMRKDIKIPTKYQTMGWPIAITLFTSMLFMTKLWNSGTAFTLAESCFYFSLSKFLYVVAIGWMVLCCATGIGGVINYILSLKLWVPMARISFVTFLIAPFLQTFYFANSRMVVDGHRMPLIWRHGGDILISSMMGLAIYILVEAPCFQLEKLFLDIWHRFRAKKSEKSTTNESSKVYQVNEPISTKAANKTDLELDSRKKFHSPYIVT